MFTDKEGYKEYLEKQKVELSNLDETNYLQRAENGEIIINKKDFNISAIDVERYTNCINWILLKDNKTMALIKRPFGDIYRQLDKKQYDISLYNNILLPQIAKQLQCETAMYYLVKSGKSKNSPKQILTIDFKKPNEEIIHGEKILEEVNGDINELNIQDLTRETHKYLEKKNIKSRDIDIIEKEFIKQSFYNRFVKQADENNHNWGILLNEKETRARIAPIYDVDCCCDISTLGKHVRTTNDGSKYNLKSFLDDYGTNQWFDTYIKEVIEEFNIEKAIEGAKKETGISIPTKIQDHYKTFFGERFYELKSAYKEYMSKEENKDVIR